MDTTEIIVLTFGAALVAFVLWFFFFGEREQGRARPDDAGVQRIKVTVKGGYSPDVIVLKKGVPAELEFYRDEASSCSEEVVFPDFGVSRRLPAFETTTVRLKPEREGEFTYTCGMSMMRGKLVVEG
ncbi:MAG TPA: cupredoxin domain-containing protein [Pyrinomonadaceae bacterium]|nr:cupredoxin domain-containing protein [Pyrinomonadaceae bacterium]